MLDKGQVGQCWYAVSVGHVIDVGHVGQFWLGVKRAKHDI